MTTLLALLPILWMIVALAILKLPVWKVTSIAAINSGAAGLGKMLAPQSIVIAIGAVIPALKEYNRKQGLSEEQGKKEETQINPSNIMKQVFPYFFIFLAIDGASSFLGHNFINHIDAALALIGK
jgi:hypothetical protein